MMACGNCYKTLPSDAQFCAYCQSSTDQAILLNADPSPPAPSRLSRWLALGIVLVAALGVYATLRGGGG